VTAARQGSCAPRRPLRLARVFGAASLLLTTAAARPAPPAPVAPTVAYRLTPYAQEAPALAAAWEALHTSDAHALARAREALGEGLAAGAFGVGEGRDPLDEPLARLLLGRLLDRLGDGAAAQEARAPLLAAPGSLGDVARADEAAHLTRPQDAAESIRLLWRVSSASAGHVRAAERALALGEAQGGPEDVARSLESFLEQPLAPPARRHLTLRLARLWGRAASRAPSRHAGRRALAHAGRVLRRLWWGSPPGDDAASDALRAAGTPLTYGDRAAKIVLRCSARTRRDVRKTWQAIRKLRARSAQDRRVRRWARVALDARLARGAEALAKPIRRLEALSGRLARGPFAPYYHFALASLLRRADRDDEAIAHYDAAADSAPEGVLAARARREAAGLTAYLGRPAEAAARWEELARSAPRGASHRLSLWHAGFQAWLAGDGARARTYLRALRDAYGGEQDATGLSWAARAGYWLGRVAEDAGDGALAARRFARTALRFPASYYALLARQRLAALAVPPPTAWTPGGPTVARCPDLDWTVALWRLGDRAGARREAENLLRVGRLPGSGRALLARMYEESGQLARATRLLRRGGVVAALPTGDADAALVRDLRAAFPLRYRDEVQAAAADNGLPLSLLAGLVHVESRFNARARSGPGAVGLTQVMPKTARAVGEHLLGRVVGRRALKDPKTNLAVGARLLRELLEHFGGNVALAVAAYNAGHGAVRGWLRSRGHLGTDAFVEAIPYGQARNYVRRVLSTAEVYRRLYTPRASPLYVPPTLPLTLGPFFEEARQ